MLYNSYDIQLKNTLTILLLFSIFLFPINGLPYFRNTFRELATEGSFYPVLLMMIILLFFHRLVKIDFNETTIKLLLLFLFFVILSSLVNIPSIFQNYHKGRTGIEKLIYQLLLLLFIYCSIIAFYTVLKNLMLDIKVIQKTLLYSLLFCSIIGVIEIINIFSDINIIKKILYFIDIYFTPSDGTNFTNNYIGYNFGKVKTLSFEPSFFTNFLLFSFPWILYYNVSDRNKKFAKILFINFIILIVIFNQTRTAYFAIIIQIIVFFFLEGRDIKQKILINGIIFFSLFYLLFSNLSVNTYYFKGEIDIVNIYRSLFDEKNPSNKTRYTTIKSAMSVANENPFFGVGFGQSGFHIIKYFHKYTNIHGDLLKFASKEKYLYAWPISHSLYARLAAETGYIGLLLFLLIYFYIIIYSFKLRKITEFKIILLSTIGILLSGLNTDSIKFLYISFNIAFFIYIKERYKDKEKNFF